MYSTTSCYSTTKNLDCYLATDGYSMEAIITTAHAREMMICMRTMQNFISTMLRVIIVVTGYSIENHADCY